MTARVYVNTFGNGDRKVFSMNDKYHFQIMQALTERGYAKVEPSFLEDESWLGKDGGYVVHAHLKGGGKAVYFMAQTFSTIRIVTEAIRLSNPTIVLDEPKEISSPE